MSRSLWRRVESLIGGREPDSVIEALNLLEQTGASPPGPAGERARELWEDAARHGCEEPFFPWLWCYLQATRKTLADLMRDCPME